MEPGSSPAGRRSQSVGGTRRLRPDSKKRPSADPPDVTNSPLALPTASAVTHEVVPTVEKSNNWGRSYPTRCSILTKVEHLPGETTKDQPAGVVGKEGAFSMDSKEKSRPRERRGFTIPDLPAGFSEGFAHTVVAAAPICSFSVVFQGTVSNNAYRGTPTLALGSFKRWKSKAPTAGALRQDEPRADCAPRAGSDVARQLGEDLAQLIASSAA